jgi:hypothetical protein
MIMNDGRMCVRAASNYNEPSKKGGPIAAKPPPQDPQNPKSSLWQQPVEPREPVHQLPVLPDGALGVGGAQPAQQRLEYLLLLLLLLAAAAAGRLAPAVGCSSGGSGGGARGPANGGRVAAGSRQLLLRLAPAARVPEGRGFVWSVVLAEKLDCGCGSLGGCTAASPSLPPPAPHLPAIDTSCRIAATAAPGPASAGSASSEARERKRLASSVWETYRRLRDGMTPCSGRGGGVGGGAGSGGSQATGFQAAGRSMLYTSPRLAPRGHAPRTHTLDTRVTHLQVWRVQQLLAVRHQPLQQALGLVRHEAARRLQDLLSGQGGCL